MGLGPDGARRAWRWEEEGDESGVFREGARGSRPTDGDTGRAQHAAARGAAAATGGLRARSRPLAAAAGGARPLHDPRARTRYLEY